MPDVPPPEEPSGPTLQAWGAVAGTYRWQEPLQRRSLRTLLEVLAPAEAEVLLDLGAGTGLVPRLLGRPAPGRTLAVEPDDRMVAVGDFAGAGVLRADATRLPLPDASVDVVTAAWVLHVLERRQRAEALAEVARVLRPGGRLGLVVPAVPRTGAQALLRSLARAGARARGLPAFEVPHDLPGVLTDAGLQVRHHSRTGRGYLADVVVCTRARDVVAVPAPATGAGA